MVLTVCFCCWYAAIEVKVKIFDMGYTSKCLIRCIVCLMKENKGLYVVYLAFLGNVNF